MRELAQVVLLGVLPVGTVAILVWILRRYRSGAALESLGAGSREVVVSSVIRDQLLRQHRIAFSWVIGSGIVALVILVAAFLLLYLNPDEWPYAILQVAAGIGDAAVCRLFLRIWERLTEILAAK